MRILFFTGCGAGGGSMVTAAWQLSNLGGDCLVTCLLTIRQCSCVRGFFERPLAERGKTLPPPSTGSFSVGGGRRCVSVEQPSGSYCDPPSLLTILSGRRLTQKAFRDPPPRGPPPAPPERRCVGEKWQEVTGSMTSHTSSHFESSPLRFPRGSHELPTSGGKLALLPGAPHGAPRATFAVGSRLWVAFGRRWAALSFVEFGGVS